MHNYADKVDQTCKVCHVECLDCKGPLNSDCTSCSTGRFFSIGLCRTECPTGTFKNTTANNCDYCHLECASCTGPFSNNCTSCPQGKFRNITAEAACVSDCPKTSFKDPLGVCKLCAANCLTCSSTAADKCLSCAFSYFLELKSALGGTCGQTCSAKYYKSVADSLCKPCFQACATCDGPSYSQCLSCALPLALEDKNNMKQCVPQCSSGLYMDADATCKPCHATCYQCVGPASTQCTSCYERFY